MSQVNVEIKKSGNENNANTLRRFTRRIQESGIMYTVKGKRYNQRDASKLSQKKSALKNLAKGKSIAVLKKLGKFVETSKRRR